MSIRMFVEPRDIWVGVYWNRQPDELRVYVCIIPCLPVLLTFRRRADGR